MPNLIIREYNPANGAFIGNVSAISLGRIAAGSHSPVRVFDIAFTGVTSVSNLKIGLLTSGNMTVNDGAVDIAVDGSSSNGHFGIMHSDTFKREYAQREVGWRHFAAANTDGSVTSDANIEVGTRDATTSQFIYLDVEAAGNTTGLGTALYKVFFDFV